MAKSLAKELNYVYIDTGAMYRSHVARHARAKCDGFFGERRAFGLDWTDVFGLQIQPQTEQSEIHLNGVNVEKEIRSMEVAQKVSLVARVPVSGQNLYIQQRMAEGGGGSWTAATSTMVPLAI